MGRLLTNLDRRRPSDTPAVIPSSVPGISHSLKRERRHAASTLPTADSTVLLFSFLNISLCSTHIPGATMPGKFLTLLCEPSEHVQASKEPPVGTASCQLRGAATGPHLQQCCPAWDAARTLNAARGLQSFTSQPRSRKPCSDQQLTGQRGKVTY